MSADLLLRAAAKLRELAPSSRSWRRDDISVGWDDWPVMNEYDETVATGASSALASYIELMHPAVALALADAMDAVVPAVRYGGGFAARLGYGELIAVACAVLREDGESR